VAIKFSVVGKTLRLEDKDLKSEDMDKNKNKDLESEDFKSEYKDKDL